MDTSNHYNMQTLFEQLGLPAQISQIDDFINAHTLSDQQTIAQASFWNASQAGFIQEALAQDSDWTELVEHLDVQLRK